jgi:hypothetical protein
MAWTEQTLFIYLFFCIIGLPSGRDRAVGLATRYGMYGPGIESRRGGVSASVQTGPGAHPAFYTIGIGT